MEPTHKFQSLTVDGKYKVIGIKPIKTKFNNSYILLTKDCEINECLELFSTNYLTKFIDLGIIDLGNIPAGGFEFKVKYDDHTKFKIPEIDGYTHRQFTML